MKSIIYSYNTWQNRYCSKKAPDGLTAVFMSLAKPRPQKSSARSTPMTSTTCPLGAFYYHVTAPRTSSSLPFLPFSYSWNLKDKPGLYCPDESTHQSQNSVEVLWPVSFLWPRMSPIQVTLRNSLSQTILSTRGRRSYRQMHKSGSWVFCREIMLIHNH